MQKSFVQKLVILSACIFLFARLNPTYAAPADQATFTRADLVASGLTCSMCSNSIYKALVALPFVAKVSPDVEHSSFAIFFKPKATPDLDALRKAVTGAGFSVDKLTVTLSLDAVAVRNDEHVALGGLHFHFLDVPASTLSGTATLRVVDKDFLPLKAYKKYAAFTSMPCVKTGRMEACCAKPGPGAAAALENTRIYHVTIQG